MTAVASPGNKTAPRVGRILGRVMRHVGKRLPAPDRAEAAAGEPAYPAVDLVWWRPPDGLNFGDVLSPVIVTKVLADNGRSLMDQVDRPTRLLALGSILHFARDGDVIWGAGINGKLPKTRLAFHRLDVRAVRGPLTADVLRRRGIDVPEVYGDPALLLPTLFPALRPTAAVPSVIVPNLHDAARLAAEGIEHLSPRLGWNICVERILRAGLVIASSLHAIIVAEAFGIPARYVRFSETESRFKYEDYALGTGRSGLEAAASIDEAREMGGMPAIRFDSRRLLEAFPIDLWRPDVT
jgi:pyruvyltransferase